MPDEIQKQPYPHPRPVRPDREDSDEYELRRPRSGMPFWGWLLILLGLLPLFCGGLMLVGLGFFWAQAPSPPAIAPPAPLELPAPVENGLPELIAPPTPAAENPG